jgi:hypothetical protein
MSDLQTSTQATVTKSAPSKAKPKTYEVHPIANIFPRLGDAKIDELAFDIKANGQQQPIVLLEGKILDGVNRYEACQRLGIEVKTCDYDGADPIGFVLSANLHRRHLDASQRAMVAAKLTNLDVGANQHTDEGTSIDVASKWLNVGRASIDRARVILKSGNAELIKAVEASQTSVNAAAQEVKPKKGNNKKKTVTPNSSKLSDQADDLLDKLVELLGKMKPKQQVLVAAGIVQRLEREGFIDEREEEDEQEAA